MDGYNPHAPGRTAKPQCKAESLRSLLATPDLEFLVEAHSGVSARIAEEAGFRGIWASGLAISASMGLPDNNEASLSEMLQVVEYMIDRISVPVLVDGDTGYGDYNNVRRLVRKLESRGAAGLCLEDKQFPKRNSFIRGAQQELAGTGEFCGKIRAAKDAQISDQFVLVARIEAFVVGFGLDEAIQRADAYAAAGADAILIHSSQRTAREVLSFKSAWKGTLPVIVVPTRYYGTSTDTLEDAGFSVCIWANHLLRASVAAMQRVACQIQVDRNLIAAEQMIVPLSEIFRLQDEAELAAAERCYSFKHLRARVILLAASRGLELGELTAHMPKAMVNVGDQPLLSRILQAYGSVGLADVTVVRGYEKDTVSLEGPTYVDNDEYETSGEAWSLWQARDALVGECIVGYGDVLFRRHIASMILDYCDDFVISAETQWRPASHGRTPDLINCSECHSRSSYSRRVLLRGFVPSATAGEPHAEWMGLLRMSARGTQLLKELMTTKAMDGSLRTCSIPDLLCALIGEGAQVRVLFTTGHWIDVDTLEDVLAAAEFT